MSVSYPEACKLREQRKPSPVKLHHVPDWFRRRILKRFGTRHGNTSGSLVFQFFHDTYRDQINWIDHYGSTKLPDGTVAFVSEPYQNPENVQESVAALAKELGCAWFISDNSYWYPGSTIRIAFHEDAESTPINKLFRRPRGDAR